MPNAFAHFVLLASPFAVIVLFRVLPFERAIIWSMLGTYLFLPPNMGIALPIVPDLDKTTLPALTILLCCIPRLREAGGILPDSWLVRFGLLLYLFAAAGTVLTNTDPIVLPEAFIPAMQPIEALVSVLDHLITIIPFVVAARLLNTDLALREMMLALFIAGLVYSIPMLIEIRLSPQLNVWIYGYFQSYFDQMMRYGGFRPLVFLNHGLWVAFFAMTTVLAAFALTRWETQRRALYLFGGMYLLVVLVLCKSTGSMIYAILLGPLIVIAGRRLQITLAALMVVIVLFYPALRSADVIPAEALVEVSSTVNSDRGGSLGYRFNAEQMFLERVSTRPVFGWGGWGRAFPHNPRTGEPLVAIDGEWIVIISHYGWAGFLGQFGLLSLPLLLLWARATRWKNLELSPYIGPLALLLAANIFDLLPNATLIPFTWLMSGTVLGYVEARAYKGAAVEPVARPVPPPPVEPATRPRIPKERTWI